MEIERKYLIKQPPQNLSSYAHLEIEQGYLSTEPVLRIRRQDNDYILTYKSKGLLEREEYNLPLTKESYDHLKGKTDGILICKTRYQIPYLEKYTIELDIFHGHYQGLVLGEVEFASREDAMSFTPPTWFGEEVTFLSKYQNSSLSKGF